MYTNEMGKVEPTDPIGGVVNSWPASRQSSEQMRPLWAVVDGIGSEISGHPADELFSLLTYRLTQGTPFCFAGIWLVDVDGSTLNRDCWCGRAFLRPVNQDTVALHRSMIGQFMLDNRPIQFDGELVAPELLSAWGDSPEYLTAFLGLPLIRGANTLGILCLLGSRWLSPEEITLLSLLARQVALEATMKDLAASPVSDVPETEPLPANMTRSAFTSRVIHELRSPLTSMRGNVQLATRALQKGDLVRAGRRLDAALDSADTMTGLLDDLHDMSLLEKGEFSLTPSPADLTEILARAVERVRDELDARYQVLNLDAPEHLPGVCDIRRLEQCLFNLIANAVKYSPSGRVVRVRLEKEAESATISIIDEGAGIPEEEHDRIFEPYYRGAVIDTVDARGLGLGLPISRAIAEGHGGCIDVQSEPGRGSTFIVRLPLAPPGAAGS